MIYVKDILKSGKILINKRDNMFFNDSTGSKYFTKEELACKKTGTFKVAKGFIKHLHELREITQIPFIVNSCCRAKVYNDEIGGHPRSLHVSDNPHHPTNGTCAIDISSNNLNITEKYTIIGTALIKGWCVGIGEDFLHLDRRIDFKVNNTVKPFVWKY